MATREPKRTSALAQQAVALAEQLGRIVGSLEGTAEEWLNRASLVEQLTRVRDGAADMLEQLADGVERGRRTTKTARKGSAGSPAVAALVGPAHAPGKRHRTLGPSSRGVKKSDQRIPKMRTAVRVRQRRKTYA